MADTFKIYSKDGKTVVASGVSPINITGLTPNTTYAAGTYLASRVVDNVESSTVPIPEFKTQVRAVSGVTVDKPTVSVKVGEGANITVNIAPADATNKEFTLEGTDNTIATNTITGTTIRFTGVKEGTFTATVKSKADATKTATIAVTVTAAA